MTITLGPEAERLIQEKLNSGQYDSAEQVVLAALEALHQQAEDDFEPGELESLLAEGEASLQKHGPIPAEAVFEELRKRSEARRSQVP